MNRTKNRQIHGGSSSNPLRLISFDIGIKNMAFCLISRETDSEPLIIEKWQTMNLAIEAIQDKNTIVICECNVPLKGKRKSNESEDRPCGKKAVYQSLCGEHTFCKKHATVETLISREKTSSLWVPMAENSWAAVKKWKMPQLRDFAERFLRGAFSSTPRRAELLARIQAELESRLLRPIVEEGQDGLNGKNKKKQKANDVSLVDIGRRMTDMLDACVADEPGGWSGLTHVVIENQISPIAARMKTIQGMLSQYFIMRCPRETHIEYVSSANKLRGLETSDNEVVDSCEEEKDDHTATVGGGGKHYRLNKMRGIELGRRILSERPEMAAWRECVEAHKKKDDLYDAFLQGLAYVGSHTKRE